MPPRHGEMTQVGPICDRQPARASRHGVLGLAGPRFNGACFAEDALVRGASGVVVAGRDVEPWREDGRCVVDDGLQALCSLAAWQRRQFSGRVVAVTGSVGKTTTRLMIDTVLRSKFAGMTSPHNYNNHVGVPLSMFAARVGARLRQRWNWARAPRAKLPNLPDYARPHIGVVTKIGEAHLGGFGRSVKSPRQKQN